MRQLVRHLLFGLACVLLSAVAFAQATSATLNGTVTDPGGSAIVGAKLLLTNVDTNLKETAVSNDTGTYSASQLPPGRYTVSVQKDGFRKSVQTGIVLTVGQVATLNISLQVGDIKETITVTANEELINVTTAELSSVVDQSSVAELPLNGRDPSSLVLLTTGTMNLVPSNTLGSATGGGWLQSTNAMPDESGASSGGGRQGSTYYVLDGAPHMDTYMGLAAPFPNADATQEFRVITENFDAQYGFSPNAVVNIQTKSGTNAIHGGAFEFYRDQVLNAPNFGGGVDPLKRNQFGAYAGGPIIKDKLFFFGNYQATRKSYAATGNSTYTPTAAMMLGDFSAVPGTLNAPFHTVLGVKNQIDPHLFNATAVTIAMTAMPVGQRAADGYNTFTGPAQISSYNEGTGRLDYTINDQQHLFVRSFTQYYKADGGALKGNIAGGASADATPAEYYNVALGHSWMINNTTANNFTVYYSQMDISDVGQALDKSGTAVCWSRYLAPAINELPGHCDLEGFSINGSFGSGWEYFMDERRTTWGFSDQLSKTIQKHILSVGFDLHRQFAKEFTDYPIAAMVGFSGNYTGFGLADFLLGDVNSFDQGAGEIADVIGWQLGMFAQEQYHIKPNITLTAGLRLDPNLAPTSVGGRGAAFIPGQQSTMYPNAPLGVNFPGDKGVNSALMPNSWGYFQPRVGLTWQPSFAPHTSIRAGAGLFTGPMPYSYYNHVADIAPFSPTFGFSGTPTTPISLNNPWAFIGAVNPFPPFASTSVVPPKGSLFQTPMTLSAIFANNFRESMTQSWSLSVEQQLSSSFALHIAYVGSETYHESVVVDQNTGLLGALPYTAEGLGQILTDESGGTAMYHSLQASVDKHMSHGFQFHSNFTWSKVIDTASEGDISEGGGTPAIKDSLPGQLRKNRGISDLNIPLISTSNFTYTSPSLKGMNPFLRAVFGSWGLSAIITMESGRPFGIQSSGSANNSGSNVEHDRADWVPGASAKVKQGSKSQWLASYFNMAAFQQNAAGTFGDTSKNFLKGPHMSYTDSAITKNWKFQDRYGVQFRWEAFNTFNDPSYESPVNTGVTGSDITLGTSTAITHYGDEPARVMQGALKLTF
jgi:hypothetical protein